MYIKLVSLIRLTCLHFYMINKLKTQLDTLVQNIIRHVAQILQKSKNIVQI